MNIRWYLLGTGAAVPLNRGLPCNALRVENNFYLFDVGEGCQEKLFKAGLGVVKAKAIFITHLHGDHFLGLFGLIQSMHMLNRREDLYIYAPNRLWNILNTIFSNSVESTGFNIVFHSIKKDALLYEDNYLKVYSFQTDHGIESYGFVAYVRVRKKQKKIVYTGDTRPIPNTIEASENADLLIHEATFTSNKSREAYEQGHSTSMDAAIIAREAKVRQLVLTHISARYESPLPLYYDAYRFFDNVIIGEDLMVIYV